MISASSLDSLEINKPYIYNDVSENAQQINMSSMTIVLNGNTCLSTFSWSRSSRPAMNLSSL